MKASNYLRDGFLLPKMKGFISIGLLILSNTFMTLAWYGHLKFKDLKGFENLGIISVVLISWGIALFEYFLQVPANRIGFREYGGPFSLLQLKVIQEVISITVFLIFALLFFKSEHLRLNHVIAFILLVIAVYLVFKK
ncbi:DMT family protein [Schleiferia thermophila]|nr:DMT family protein [Schleiferia thermophila]